MISSRIPVYIKEYCEQHNIKIGDLIMKGFDAFRATDKEHALSRLEYHEKRVLHWRHIVLHFDDECNTKQAFCNTLKKDFLSQNRGSKENFRGDMSWCDVKSKQLIDEGIIITPKELYDFCTRKDGGKK